MSTTSRSTRQPEKEAQSRKLRKELHDLHQEQIGDLLYQGETLSHTWGWAGDHGAEVRNWFCDFST